MVLYNLLQTSDFDGNRANGRTQIPKLGNRRRARPSILASAPRKEQIFLAIILFRLCDGENSRGRRRARERGRLLNFGI